VSLLTVTLQPFTELLLLIIAERERGRQRFCLDSHEEMPIYEMGAWDSMRQIPSLDVENRLLFCDWQDSFDYPCLIRE
jgi:hypothetical protein